MGLAWRRVAETEKSRASTIEPPIAFDPRLCEAVWNTTAPPLENDPEKCEAVFRKD
jgi:hypothetical protein